jgi:hypothetical protein
MPRDKILKMLKLVGMTRTQEGLGFDE